MWLRPFKLIPSHEGSLLVGVLQVHWHPQAGGGLSRAPARVSLAAVAKGKQSPKMKDLIF